MEKASSTTSAMLLNLLKTLSPQSAKKATDDFAKLLKNWSKDSSGHRLPELYSNDKFTSCSWARD